MEQTENGAGEGFDMNSTNISRQINGTRAQLKGLTEDLDGPFHYPRRFFDLEDKQRGLQELLVRLERALKVAQIREDGVRVDAEKEAVRERL